MLIAGRSRPLSADSFLVSTEERLSVTSHRSAAVGVYIPDKDPAFLGLSRALQRRAQASLFVLVLINLLCSPHKLAVFLKQGSKYPTHETVPDPSHGQKFQTLAAAASVSINENLASSPLRFLRVIHPKSG